MFLITLHLSWITLKATENQNRVDYNYVNDWIKYTVKHNNAVTLLSKHKKGIKKHFSL